MSRTVERALQYHRAGFFKLAIDWYDKALEEHPGNVNLVGNRAENYIKVGRFDEAISDYQVVLAVQPNNEAIWVNFGLALQCSGNYDAAVVAYDRAIEIQTAIRSPTSIRASALSAILGAQARASRCSKRRLSLTRTS